MDWLVSHDFRTGLMDMLVFNDFRTGLMEWWPSLDLFWNC
jgi:hypothetical protein